MGGGSGLEVLFLRQLGSFHRLASQGEVHNHLARSQVRLSPRIKPHQNPLLINYLSQLLTQSWICVPDELFSLTDPPS